MNKKIIRLAKKLFFKNLNSILLKTIKVFFKPFGFNSKKRLYLFLTDLKINVREREDWAYFAASNRVLTMSPVDNSFFKKYIYIFVDVSLNSRGKSVWWIFFKKIGSHLCFSCSKSIENTLQSLPITQIGNGLEWNSSFTMYPPYCNAKMYTAEQIRGVAPSVCMANPTCQPKKRTGLGLSTIGLLLLTSLRV